MAKITIVIFNQITLLLKIVKYEGVVINSYFLVSNMTDLKEFSSFSILF